ncbi:rab proteins geranylgeranyltransferase component A 2-like [Asterias rubens]|uniref:rab proteins geranylgeranyltransferase component A 2-like n=1 Tax=Asterias rubens TaxID=7604 RepID=UPI001455834C|nr:rab proteins geranylgeranyltransferase component A 2-like [Asterias rubens]
MAAPDLPTEYDEIVLGTGLQESILAAALARIGHRVLHLDRNDYYSGSWATFHLRSLLDWIDRNKALQESDGTANSSNDQTTTSESDVSSQLREGECFLDLPQDVRTVTDLDVTCYVRDGVELPSLERVIVPPRVLDEDQVPEAQGAEGQNAPQIAPESPSTSNQDELQAEGGEQAATNQNQESSQVTPADQSGSAEGAAGGLVPPGQDEGQSAEQGQRSNEAASGAVSGQGAAEQEPGSLGQEAEGQGSGDQRSPAEVQRVAASNRTEWTWAKIDQMWRKFNIDLAPKLMFCRGSMVELLVTSRISRYAEFKAVSRILTVIDDKLEQVPCSRADVFSSKYVSVLEKRMLMRVIEFSMNYQDRLDEYEEYRERPFEEFLKSRKLTPTLQHFVMHSIAMVNANTPTEEALKATQIFLRSLGRYGNTAFLWTLYGSGELPQCFCRLCAVFAGIYMLRTNVKKLIIDDNNLCKGAIDSDGRRLTCNNLIMETSYAPPQAVNIGSGTISRGILLTDRPLKNSDNEEITLLTVPPTSEQNSPIRVLELGHGSCACPRDMFVVHLTSTGTGQAKNDLQYALEKLFQPLNKEDSDSESVKPKVLWSLFFSQVDTSVCDDEALAAGLPSNVLVTAGPGTAVGFEHAVAQAKRLFEKICPGEDFLPAAPEPEDIVFEDHSKDNPGEHKEVGFEANPSSNDDAKKPEAVETETEEGCSSKMQEQDKDEKQDATPSEEATPSEDASKLSENQDRPGDNAISDS